MNRTVRLLALTAFLFPGCDSAVDCSADPDCVEPGATVLVGNQGNFTDQTGSVTVYDATADEATQNALGVTNALVQGLYLDPASDDRLFVLLNFNDSFSTGRGRVDVVDLASNTVTAQIDVDTPRSAYRDGDVLWVTNLYGNTVTPIDLTTNTAGTPVDVGTNPEGLTRAEGGLYVADNGFGLGTTVSVVDPAARTVARTLDLACDGPKTLATDAEGEVWVFCTGKTVYDEDFNVIEQTNGGVVVLDGATGAEVTRFDLPGQLGAGSILGQEAVVVPARREAWAIVGDRVIRFDTATNAQGGAITPEVPAGSVLGGIAYNPADDRLYLAAAASDFVSSGQVVITDREGRRVGSFPAGVTPAAFAIR